MQVKNDRQDDSAYNSYGGCCSDKQGHRQRQESRSVFAEDEP
jgi:hypothetical protein